jgi:hypothetical protein
VNPQAEVNQLAGPEYQCHCLPYILALTPYGDVFVTIDSNLISKFVSLHPVVAHDVVMAVLLGVCSSVCLFVCLLSLVAFRCNKNPTDEMYSEVCSYFLEPSFPHATEVHN